MNHPEPTHRPRPGPASTPTSWSSGAGVTGIYQLYLAREAGFSGQILEAGGGVGRDVVLEPLPRAAGSTRRATPTPTCSRRSSSTSGSGRSSSPSSPRPSATSTTWSTGSTSDATSASTPGSRRPPTTNRRGRGRSRPTTGRVPGPVPGGRHRRALGPVLPGRARPRGLPRRGIPHGPLAARLRSTSPASGSPSSAPDRAASRSPR